MVTEACQNTIVKTAIKSVVVFEISVNRWTDKRAKNKELFTAKFKVA